MAHTLVLFDIDGTLLITRGMSSRCFRLAGEYVAGTSLHQCDLTAGLLDPQLFAELAQQNGIANALSLHDGFRDRYLIALTEELARRPHDVVVLPGVRELLAALAGTPNVTVGLLSGNYRRAAELKLGAAGLDRAQFTIAALGEDAPCRDELPAVAMRQYVARTGQPISAEQVVVVGDTPRDVACAHAQGCRVVAVATGRYDRPTLQDAGADHVLDTLALPASLDAIFATTAQPTPPRSAPEAGR